ncbi:hypothetical protein JTB14_036279 [Gonioctena quinquepunctata]|nr:hypothetical protein JTB14_036279 [Gonioctena quinquepunctata]
MVKKCSTFIDNSNNTSINTSEITQRVYRSYNVIISGLPDQPPTNDKTSAGEILEFTLQESSQNRHFAIKAVARLGNMSPNTQKIARLNKSLLAHQTHKNSRLQDDKTPTQVKEPKTLRGELQRRIDSGESVLTIICQRKPSHHKCAKKRLTTTITFLYTNINSVLAKFDDFKLIVQTVKPDCILLTETWLNNSIPDSMAKLPGYISPSPQTAGGTCIYLKRSTFRQHHINQYSHDISGIENIWLQIRKSEVSLTLSCIYRPPSPNINSDRAMNNFPFLTWPLEVAPTTINIRTYKIQVKSSP